jgi:transcriptional regulator with XRE-family HTH domain
VSLTAPLELRIMNETGGIDWVRQLNPRAQRLGAYLRARRDLVRPEQVGITADGHRRVAGLRREEVAAAAGISSEYYLRLEQGRDHQPSDAVVDSLASALRLDVHATRYLRELVHPLPSRPLRAQSSISPSVLELIHQVRPPSAFVLNRNQDVLFAAPAAARVAPAIRAGRNALSAVFERRAADALPDWEETARSAVAAFRRDGVPEDARFRQILGDLELRSANFRRIWARHDVGPLSAATLRAEVAPFGSLEFHCQPFAIPESGQTIITMSAPPGSRAAAALAFADAGSASRR